VSSLFETVFISIYILIGKKIETKIGLIESKKE